MIRVAQFFALLWVGFVSYSTAIAEISLAAGVAALIVAAIRGEYRPRVRSRFVRYALLGWALFVGWVLVSHLFAMDSASAAKSFPKMFRYAPIVLLGLLPRDRRFDQIVMWILTILSVVLVFDSAIPFLQNKISRASTDHMHYNTVAQVGAAISILLTAAAIGMRNIPIWWRVAFAIGALGGIFTLISTLSRMAWVAWFSALPILVLLVASRRWRMWLVIAGVVVMASAATVGPVRTRVAQLNDINDPRFTRRYDMWAMGSNLIAQHPIVGVGPSGVAMVYDEEKIGALIDDPRQWVHLHNDFINIAAYHGIPASLLWALLSVGLYWMIGTWLLGRRTQRPPVLAFGAALSLHVFFLCGMLHDTVPIYRKLAWHLLLWGLLINSLRQTEASE